MGNDGANPEIQIGVTLQPGTGPGATAANADIDRVVSKVTEARAAEAAAAQQSAAATSAAASAESEAAKVAEMYGVSLQTAEKALQLLGAESGQATANLDALDAAMDQAQASTREISAAQAAYNLQVKESAAALLSEMEAIDATGSAQERNAAATDLVTKALQRMGITEAEVTAISTKMAVSFEVAARAMVQIKQAELAEEVTRVRAEIEGVVPAIEGTQTGLAKVGEEFSKLGNQRHILTSVREIAQGGARAIRGEAEAAFLLGNALEAIVPGVGILIAVGSGIALISQILEEHAEKADKVKQSDKELADGAETASQKLKDLQTSSETTYNAIATAADRAAAAVQAHVKALREQQRAQDELNDAELAARIANLDQEEYKKQQGKSPEEKEGITREYDIKRLNLRQERTQEKANEAAIEKRQDIDAANAEIAAKQAEQSKKDADIASKQDALARAQINAGGIQSDAESAQSDLNNLQQKQFTTGLTADESQRLQQLLHDVPDLVAKEAVNGKTYNAALDSPAIDGVPGSGGLRAQLKDQEKIEKDALESAPNNPVAGQQAADARANIDRLQDQINAIIEVQGLTAGIKKPLEENQKSREKTEQDIEELRGHIVALQKELLASQINVTTVALTGFTTREKAVDKNNYLQEKAEYDEREASRYARKKAADDAAADPNATPDQRAASKALADHIDAEGLADKLAHAVALGISQAEQTKLSADLKSANAHANDVVGVQNKKDATEAAKASTKELHEQIAHVGAAIEASGNKEAIENLKTIRELLKDNPTAELAALTRDWVLAQQQSDHQTKQAIEDLRKHVQNLGHP